MLSYISFSWQCYSSIFLWVFPNTTGEFPVVFLTVQHKNVHKLQMFPEQYIETKKLWKVKIFMDRLTAIKLLSSTTIWTPKLFWEYLWCSQESNGDYAFLSEILRLRIYRLRFLFEYAFMKLPVCKKLKDTDFFIVLIFP